ncbi:MAG: DnaJ domain-containing protein [Gammaproteobacteria bacterium]
MKNRRNYYRILHIQPDAPADIIKASYRTQMQKLKMHPDLGGDEWDASVLNEAYRVLSNPKARAAYDATFMGGRDRPFNAAQSGGDRSHDHYRSADTATANAPIDMSACAFCQTPRPAEVACAQQPFCSGCGGPLQVAGTKRIAGTRKRCFERMQHHAPVTVYLDTECRGQCGKLRDLSPAGLQVQVSVPLRAGQLVRLSGEDVATIGRVMYCNRSRHSGQFIAGIAFITVHFHRRAGTFISGHA